jgi:uncharacterized damage-inducible protein DinB
MKVITPPTAGTYSEYQKRYVDLLAGKNPLSVLEKQVLDFKVLLSEIPFEKEGHAYADGKWTIKQVVGHMIDTERILAYRALCIARGEKINLPAFEENDYVANASFNDRTLTELAREFGVVREATLLLYRHMNEEELDRLGMANNTAITPRALVFFIAGHHIHHERVLRERYVPELV